MAGTVDNAADEHRFRFDTVQNEPAFDHDGADAFAKFRAEPPLMRKLRKGIGPFYDTLRNSVGARGTVLRDVAPNLVQILLRLSTEADLQILFPRGPTTASFSLESVDIERTSVPARHAFLPLLTEPSGDLLIEGLVQYKRNEGVLDRLFRRAILAGGDHLLDETRGILADPHVHAHPRLPCTADRFHSTRSRSAAQPAACRRRAPATPPWRSRHRRAPAGRSGRSRPPGGRCPRS